MASLALIHRYLPLYNVIFICFLLLSCVNCIKLNVPRVLLPFSQSVSANFTLEVTDGGCFKWYISRPEIIRLYILDDEGEGCSARVVVSSISKTPTQQSALVTLINDVTGESLHCDVTITSIYELEITTTTRELLLEDTPEAFTVRAKDKEGDTFSSIDGLVFDWNLVTDIDSSEVVEARNVLRFMKFSESTYKASSSIYSLEAQNLKGYTVLVQGIKTGTAKVQAVLKDSAYPDSLSTEVTLTVVANLALFPSYEIRMIVGTFLTYRVHLIQQGKAQEIPMPTEQFYLQIEDENVAHLDSSTSEVSALHVGYTTIVLKDRNIKSKQQCFRQPSAGIHVVLPYRIGFVVLPSQNWYLVNESQYTILIKLYDGESNEIYNTENIRFQAVFPDDYFDVRQLSENGTFYRVTTKKVGFTKISAKLLGIVNKHGYIIEVEPVIEGSQNVEVMEPVSVSPKVTVLPWNLDTKPSFRVHFEASGGGNYGFVWKTSNPAIASCNQMGDVVTKSQGSVNVTASSFKNPSVFGLAFIHIFVPSELGILDSYVEAELGDVINIPVALYSFSDTEVQSAKLAITECFKHPIGVEVFEAKKFEYLPSISPLWKICTFTGC